MSAVRLSFNKACMITGLLFALISASMISALYAMTGDRDVIWWGLLYAFLAFSCMAFLVSVIRQNLLLFSDTLCKTLDEMMAGEAIPPRIRQEESIFYKIHHRLTRLYEVMDENRRSIAKERADLQELISDISHQVKTPIANLKMVNATLLEQPVPRERLREFLAACGGQLDKLDFLMQAMIKTSRLETGVISLEMKAQPIFDTLAAALGGILLNAEQKNISDTGRGIPENHHGAIFKRFYREEEVHDTPGIGIGLYLAREIITMQGGYIKVASEAGRGAVFSVFLPRN